MTAYYNEIDPQAAQWLRNLIAAGHIAPGDVDERSILDVKPSDLSGYTQCHFFAGVGIWSLALRRAGWPDDRPVWAGSCPCQPFSSAGKSAGFADERHLWPYWHHLIRVMRPGRVFGEQVAGKDGLGWLDLVQADLEGEGYAVAPVDLCAAGVGSPNIRQRLWFVAERLEHTGDDGPQGRLLGRPDAQWQAQHGPPGRDGATGRVADAKQQLHVAQEQAACHGGPQAHRPADRLSGCSIPHGRLADPADIGRQERRQRLAPEERDGAAGDHGLASGQPVPGPTNGFW